MKPIWFYSLLVFLGGCCFGLLSTFVKLAYTNGFTLAQVTGLQFLFGLLLIWVFVPFVKKDQLTNSLKTKVFLSGLPMGLTGVFYYQSLQTIDASIAIILLFQFVWIGSLLEWFIDRKKPNQLRIMAIGTCMIGSILAGGFFMSSLELTWYGTIWGLLAAMSFSAFIYLSGKVAQTVPAIQKSAWLTAGGFVVVFIIFLPTYIREGFPLETMIAVAPYGLFLGLFGVLLPPLLFSIGMPKVGGGLGTILSSSELPVAILMSTIILKETVSVVQWIGVVIILVGIALGNGVLSQLVGLRKTRISVIKNS
ncbi:EamA family transporter [Alkalihalobacillus hemicellulosilyticus]|uniref:Permease of the drug/metabolite transporter n=1 Tax=Halalkalibacter hemicellulosilyticusJCM 9152 TaxID=1236971 RepID=W4QFF1_9BACI|nr:DMT family transporter [Halalkalibacter hemicellulosilyticus]GAE30811.1 permease of the drug/metabolite transporter [Halalkalibacter hemicellulosilyticusJCM 9152]